MGGVGVGGDALEGVPVEISRDDLRALVEASEVVLERESHRLVHEGDWRRWGARGGKETLRRYGTDWFSLLALRRWGRITASELEAARVIRWRLDSSWARDGG